MSNGQREPNQQPQAMGNTQQEHVAEVSGSPAAAAPVPKEGDPVVVRAKLDSKIPSMSASVEITESGRETLRKLLPASEGGKDYNYEQREDETNGNYARRIVRRCDQLEQNLAEGHRICDDLLRVNKELRADLEKAIANHVDGTHENIPR